MKEQIKKISYDDPETKDAAEEENEETEKA